MNSRITTLLLAGSALLAGVAQAAPTNIAQVPLLNIEGTGSVKPNIMLLYDNSGSMADLYTPDYIVDSYSCRSRSATARYTTGCSYGHPPYHSADFNKQYYNPAITYTPPVDYLGTAYDAMTSAKTSGWTVVPTDGFGVNQVNLKNRSEASTNLLTSFPDKEWCRPNTSDCRRNGTTYPYPSDTYYDPNDIGGAPFYYSINTVEYCTDANLKTCKVVGVGEPAPAGYSFPAKVRWCNSSSQTDCQGKYTGTYKYPRFGNLASNYSSFGTITIGATSSQQAMQITSVSVIEGSTPVVITNNAVSANLGTNTSSKQATLASLLAVSIAAKTGLANQYTACVRTPVAGALDCDTLGITLNADNVVAVVPLSCPSGAASKSDCSILYDNSRNGWAITAETPSVQVSAASPRTTVVKVSGTTAKGKNANPSLSGMKANGVDLWSSALALGKNVSSDVVVDAILGKAVVPSNRFGVYSGGNTVSNGCRINSSSSAFCVVDETGSATSLTVTMGTLTDGNTIKFSFLSYGPTEEVNESIPVTTVPLAGGSAVFVRTDIVPANDRYPRGAGRTDCANAAYCTYAEEMTNFANWYAYYKTRNQMMKTAVGQAFRPLDGNFRVGIVALSNAAASSVDVNTFKVPKEFTGTDRSAWYTKLYGMSTSGSTPLRPALDTVGKMYANLAPFDFAAGEEVVRYPCQQNFTFLTTDGYWNGGDARSAIQASIDQAANAAMFCTREAGCVDPTNTDGRSLADVALYWYNGGSNSPGGSLREALEDRTRPTGSVPAGPNDNTRLHMNTYTLGLGVDGVMAYEADYDTAPKPGGDFYKLINGVSSGCPWNANGAYVWPNLRFDLTSAGDSVQARVDDLWHAAINGHGKYFSASDPTSVVTGLNAALNNIKIKQGAAAAAATSTPNISQEDNDIFSDTFTTVKWYGELTDKKINTVTGEVGAEITWTTSSTLGTRVEAAADSRVIKMRDVAGAGLKDFSYAGMTALEKSWFDNKCGQWAQCTILTTDERTAANSGANLVNWLRGQQQYANNRVFRAYSNYTLSSGATVPIVLGDIASAKPAYLREPRKSYDRDGYSNFKSAQADRAATVFTAANDGMLHAFRASDGRELWAYAPRIPMRKLYAQANTSYGTNHQFTVDGSPELGDVWFDDEWHTVLVAGLNAGGRGYYALDVTDPAHPVSLWEICADQTVCPSTDARYQDLGLTFGNPQFGVWKGRWVVMVASGYNNVPGVDGVNAGDGGAYLYVLDVKTGAILDRLAAGSADSTTPPGLAKITAITENPNVEPEITFVYGGDNKGRMWRFDFTQDPAQVSLLADAGLAQPITTRPDVTVCQVDYRDNDGKISESRAEKVVVFGTGRLLDVSDVANTDVQSVYALKDGPDTITPWRDADVMHEETLTPTTTRDADGHTVSGPPWTVGDGGVDLSLQKGWYLDFDQNDGERVNLDPKVVAGSLNVVTNIPSSSSACMVGGTSNVYGFNVCNGQPLKSDGVVGRTLSNNSGAVGFIIVRLPSGTLKMITTTADGKTVTTGVTGARSLPPRRAGWRRVLN